MYNSPKEIHFVIARESDMSLSDGVAPKLFQSLRWHEQVRKVFKKETAWHAETGDDGRARPGLRSVERHR